MASRSTDPRRDRALLAAAALAAFALSAVTDLRLLGAAAALLALLLRRGLWRPLRRALRAAVPVTASLSAASWLLLWALQGTRPDPRPYLALASRAALVTLLTFAVLERVELLRAVAPWPAASRLLVITLAQIHALRLLATDSLQGLRSRLVRRPGPADAVRGASGATAALLALSTRNARDVADALRSRGF
ncbi:MAG: hypothetical protein QM767_19290 [Anaeromyxobacter sp.]